MISTNIKSIELKIKKLISKEFHQKIFRYYQENECFENFNEIKNCDVIIICVPTPLVGSNKPDLSFIKKTVASISKRIKFGQVIILESTSYPGTTQEEIIKKLDKKFIVGKNLFVGFSSERINPGVNEKHAFSYTQSYKWKNK